MIEGYNNMFAISEVKRRFIDAESGQSVNYSGGEYNVKYKYDLPNDNIYTIDGKLFKTADQVSNNTSYLLYLHHAHILEVKPFLNYQFSKTPDKELFLDYTEYGIASHKSISEGKGKLISEWVKAQRVNIKAPPPVLVESWKELIIIELHDRLSEVEGKIEDKIIRWKQGEMKIECAAFCQLLFDKKYFVAKSTKRVTVNKFALSKYGADILNQLQTKFEADRENHKKLLNKYFK